VHLIFFATIATMRRKTLCATYTCGLTAALFAAIPASADRIVLRNLTVISDKTVASFDEDGIRFAEGGGVAWDEVERGTVAADKQLAFDKMLQELGEHLYRIRQRLGVEDYQGLLPHAEAVYPRYRQRRSETAYLVCQAVMWGRLADRRREEALEPYLRCYELLRAAQGKPLKLPGDRTLQVDLETGLSPELLPVWFDTQAAAKVLDEAFQTISQMAKPLPEATRVYYATLALAAGDDAKAMSVLRGFAPASPAVEQLRDVALAQREVIAGQSGAAIANLETKLEGFSPVAKPVALYWIGRAKITAANERTRQDGMLQLLRIAAVYGDQHPELAAAGLFHTMEGLANTSGAAQSAAVRKELLDRYGQTYYAARAKEQPTGKQK
jgi:hypothetical protein